MNAEDAKVAAAVERVLPRIARAIDVAAAAIHQGGRLIYVGAGTSGRLAALDATECPPTFNNHQVQFIIAGGAAALASDSEVSEDDVKEGRAEISRRKNWERRRSARHCRQRPYPIYGGRTRSR